MKKLILIAVTGVILISCVIIGAAATGSAVESGASVSETAEEEKEFVITSEHGRLVVYRSGENEPFLTTDTFTSSLPRADKRKIDEGIEVKGEENLRRALEDYCS